MHLFNTFMGLGALIVAGLIGATITFLLMNLGLKSGKNQHPILPLDTRTSKSRNPRSPIDEELDHLDEISANKRWSPLNFKE